MVKYHIPLKYVPSQRFVETLIFSEGLLQSLENPEKGMEVLIFKMQI